MQKKIAILGATGHIAKGIIYGYSKSEQTSLFLFARSMEHLNEFLKGINCFENKNITANTFEMFNSLSYDVIINCVGLGDPTRHKIELYSIFRLTEFFDNMILDYLQIHKHCIYINLSSGAVYGTEFNLPVDEKSITNINVNNITEENYYSMSKINSEVKHRAYKEFNIVDLRIFGYFSRFIDQKSSYLLNEIISCVKYSKCFKTSPDNIKRDYVHPKDLIQIIDKCILKFSINDVFDVYSLEPISKFEILEYFEKEYGLVYVIDRDIAIMNATGSKENYFSNNRRAEYIAYQPRFKALDSIIQESKLLL